MWPAGCVFPYGGETPKWGIISPPYPRGMGGNRAVFPPHIREAWGGNNGDFPPTWGGNRENFEKSAPQIIDFP